MEKLRHRKVYPKLQSKLWRSDLHLDNLAPNSMFFSTNQFSSLGLIKTLKRMKTDLKKRN